MCNRWCKYAGIAKLLDKNTKNHIMLGRQENMMDRKRRHCWGEETFTSIEHFYLFCLSCFVFEETLLLGVSGQDHSGRRLTRIKCQFSEHQNHFVTGYSTPAQSINTATTVYIWQRLILRFSPLSFALPVPGRRKAATSVQCTHSTTVPICVCLLCRGLQMAPAGNTLTRINVNCQNAKIYF